MAKTAYENLEVYRLAVDVDFNGYAAARRWRYLDRDTIGKQVVRAADSIGANIAEGFGRGNGADQKRLLRIARGSPYETRHCLKLACSRDLLTRDEITALKPLKDSLPPMLNAYMKAISRQRHTTLHN